MPPAPLMVPRVLSSIEQLYPKNLKVLATPLTRLIKTRLWLQILIAMMLGIGTGLLLSPQAALVDRKTGLAIAEWLALPGYIFLAFIQMIVIPLILSSIIRGIAAATDIQQLKNTGIWVGVFFLATTILAALIGIGIGIIVEPGTYVDQTALSQQIGKGGSEAAYIAESAAREAEQPGITVSEVPEHLTSLLPTNPVSSIVEGDMLQIVIFAIVLGIGLLSLHPESSKPLLDLFGSIQEVCMAIVAAVMTFAPVAVFGLLAQAMTKTGTTVLAGLGMYAGTVIFGMMILLAFYLVIVLVLGARNPIEFLKGIREPILLGFSTNSSAATMPITSKAAEETLGIRPSLAQFIIPLGATVNMGGTALYQGLATMFMAQMFQLELSTSALAALVVTAVGASIGTPAVPGVGIIVLATVLASAGIPLSGLALIVGLDRILERFRTSLNVTGDLAACVVMDRLIPARQSRQEEFALAEEMEALQTERGEDVIVRQGTSD